MAEGIDTDMLEDQPYDLIEIDSEKSAQEEHGPNKGDETTAGTGAINIKGEDRNELGSVTFQMGKAKGGMAIEDKGKSNNKYNNK